MSDPSTPDDGQPLDVKITTTRAIREFPFTLAPGVLLLTGPNGCGKSTVIEALIALGGGKTDLEPSDHSHSGAIDGLGAHARFGHKGTTRRGEPCYPILDVGRSIALLIHPNMKQKAAADRVRMLAAMRVLGLVADITAFRDLIPDRGEFDRIVSEQATESTDLVDMAKLVKRDIDAAALDAEKERDKASTRAAGYQEQCEEVDLEAPCDDGVLQRALREAVRFQQEVKDRQKQAAALIERREAAQHSLQNAELAYRGPSVDDAVTAERAAQDARLEQEQIVEALEDKLTVARDKLRSEEASLALSVATVESAESHQQTLRAWRQDAETGADITAIPGADIEAARQRCLDASNAVAGGIVVRRAKEAATAHDAAVQLAAEHDVQSKRLRAAAKGTNDVLTAAMAQADSPFRVGEDDELVINTARCEGEPFADLSPGQRTRTAFGMVVNRCEPFTILPIPQELWSHLDETNREWFASLAVSRRVCAVAAEARVTPCATCSGHQFVLSDDRKTETCGDCEIARASEAGVWAEMYCPSLPAEDFPDSDTDPSRAT